MEQHATEPTTNHGELLGCFGDLLHRDIELRKKCGRRLARSREIPIKRLRDLGPGLRLDANGHHLPNPGAELVAESSPRNPRLGIGVGCRLAQIELSRKVRGHRRGSRRIKTIPETAHERDALLGGKGLEGW